MRTSARTTPAALRLGGGGSAGGSGVGTRWAGPCAGAAGRRGARHLPRRGRTARGATSVTGGGLRLGGRPLRRDGGLVAVRLRPAGPPQPARARRRGGGHGGGQPRLSRRAQDPFPCDRPQDRGPRRPPRSADGERRAGGLRRGGLPGARWPRRGAPHSFSARRRGGDRRRAPRPRVRGDPVVRRGRRPRRGGPRPIAAHVALRRDRAGGDGGRDTRCQPARRGARKPARRSRRASRCS